MEQIAMLNGLGAYGENPIGDLDPRLAAARSASLRTTAVPNAYSPVPYTLGANGDSGFPTWVKWAGLGVAALFAIDWWQRRSGGPGILPFNGFEEPLMLSSLSGKKRSRRRRK